jgi:hypothetical protein
MPTDLGIGSGRGAAANAPRPLAARNHLVGCLLARAHGDFGLLNLRAHLCAQKVPPARPPAHAAALHSDATRRS